VLMVVACVRSEMARFAAGADVVLFCDITANLLQPRYNKMDTQHDGARLGVTLCSL
jgi:hypothetical protein